MLFSSSRDPTSFQDDPAQVGRPYTKVLNDDPEAMRNTVYDVRQSRACRYPLTTPDALEHAIGWRTKPSPCGNGMARFLDGWWISDIPFERLSKMKKVTRSCKTNDFPQIVFMSSVGT